MTDLRCPNCFMCYEEYGPCLTCGHELKPANELLPKRPIWRALIGPISVAIVAAVAWQLAGGPTWHWIAILSAGAVFLLVTSAVKAGVSDLRARHFLGFGYIVLSVACWIGVGYFFPINQVQLQSELFTDQCPIEGPIRVAYNGTLLSPISPDGKTFRFRGRVDKGQISVESLGPDGWVARPHSCYDGKLTVKEIPTTNLHIDNRRNGAATLKCGLLSLDIAAGFTGRIRIPSPANQTQLFIDGKEAGMIADGNCAIDVSGSHSYVLREIVYVSGLTQAMMRLDQFHRIENPLVPKPEQPDIPKTNPPMACAGQHTYQLPKKIDYFLTPHPNWVETYFENSTIRTEFVDAD